MLGAHTTVFFLRTLKDIFQAPPLTRADFSPGSREMRVNDRVNVLSAGCFLKRVQALGLWNALFLRARAGFSFLFNGFGLMGGNKIGKRLIGKNSPTEPANQSFSHDRLETDGTFLVTIRRHARDQLPPAGFFLGSQHIALAFRAVR